MLCVPRVVQLLCHAQVGAMLQSQQGLSTNCHRCKAAAWVECLAQAAQVPFTATITRHVRKAHSAHAGLHKAVACCASTSCHCMAPAGTAVRREQPEVNMRMGSISSAARSTRRSLWPAAARGLLAMASAGPHASLGVMLCSRAVRAASSNTAEVQIACLAHGVGVAVAAYAARQGEKTEFQFSPAVQRGACLRLSVNLCGNSVACWAPQESIHTAQVFNVSPR